MSVARLGLLLGAAVVTACGSAGPTGRAAPASPSPASPSPSPSYACGEGPPRHASLVSITADGAVRWTRAMPEPVSDSGQVPPLVAGGTVYVASSGAVIAVDAESGEVRWTRRLGTEGYGLWLDGGNVVALFDQVGRRGTITAVDSATGDVAWRYRVPGGGLLGNPLPTDAHGLAMVDSDGSTGVLDLRTGRLAWRKPGRWQQYGLGVGPHVVVRAAARTMTAFDASTGALRWRVPVGDTATVATDGSVLVVTAGAVGPGLDGSARGFDAATGRPLWSVKEPPALGVAGQGQAGMVLMSQGSAPPSFVFVDPRTGRVRWSAQAQVGQSLPASVTDTEVTTVDSRYQPRAQALTRRAAATGHVLSRAPLPREPARGPVTLRPGRSALVLYPLTGSTTSVVAYDGARRAWDVQLPSAKWVVPDGTGGAFVQTVDPMYACAT